MAANAAVTVARLGGSARFAGVLGDDETGRIILGGLVSEEVDVGAVQIVEGGASPESFIQIDERGERLIVNHTSPDLFERDLDGFRAPADGAVLVDMRWEAGAVAALSSAAEAGAPGIVDCDHRPADGSTILAKASHVVFGAETLRSWTESTRLGEGLERARDHTDAWLAVTDGVHGTFWLEGSELRHKAAFAVEAIDTLGAGDVFHGAFALALAEGRSEVDSIGWASAAAALKCTRFGGRAGIPWRHEVDTFMEDRR